MLYYLVQKKRVNEKLQTQFTKSFAFRNQTEKMKIVNIREINFVVLQQNLEEKI